MSEETRKTDTPAENVLQRLLAPLHLNVEYGKFVPAGEKGRVPDALLDGWLELAVEGEGSSSSDNPKREEELLQIGIHTVHIPNRAIRNPDVQELLVQFVVILSKVKLIARHEPSGDSSP